MSERSAAAPGASGKDNQHLAPKSDIEISQAAKMRPIIDVARDKLGIPAEHVQPYGHYKAKISLDYIASLDSQARRQADPGHGDHADAGRRRQDDDDRRPRRRRSIDIGKKAIVLPARAVARPLFRREGRRGRRRLCAGRADGGHQPPLHRRLPRHRRRQQSARGADRQSHLLGQRARHRHRAASPGAASST